MHRYKHIAASSDTRHGDMFARVWLKHVIEYVVSTEWGEDFNHSLHLEAKT